MLRAGRRDSGLLGCARTKDIAHLAGQSQGGSAEISNEADVTHRGDCAAQKAERVRGSSRVQSKIRSGAYASKVR